MTAASSQFADTMLSTPGPPAPACRLGMEILHCDFKQGLEQLGPHTPLTLLVLASAPACRLAMEIVPCDFKQGLEQLLR